MDLAYHAQIEATEHGMEIDTLPCKVKGRTESVPAQTHGIGVLEYAWCFVVRLHAKKNHYQCRNMLPNPQKAPQSETMAC